MKIFDIDIGKCDFSEENQYKLVFYENQASDVSTSSFEPTFQKNKLQFKSKTFLEVKESLKVSIVAVKFGSDVVMGSEQVEIAYGKEFASYSVEFSKSRGAKVDGMVRLSCKLYKQSLPETLKNNTGICCLSINAAYLNTLMEKPFDLKVLVKDPDGAVVGTTRLNNRSPASYLDIDRIYANQTIELLVSETTTKFFILSVKAGYPTVTSLTLSNGEPIVICIQLVSGEGVVTGMFHSSALREASVSVSSTGKRISLSPRRPSVLTSARGTMVEGSGPGVPAAKKSLLYLEDSYHSELTTSEEVLNGISHAMAITLDNNSAIQNNENGTKIITNNNIPTVGPKTGVYITCSSKNEILLDSTGMDPSATKKNRKNKKQLHVINLGLIKVNNTSLNNPVKFKADLIDYLLDHNNNSNNINNSSSNGDGASQNSSPTKAQVIQSKSVDAADNPENTAPPANTEKDTANNGNSKSDMASNMNSNSSVSTAGGMLQRPSVSFSGMLEETSRELFNETGLISIVLEGKLFKQKSTTTTTSNNNNNSSNNNTLSSESSSSEKRHSMLVGKDTEEACMAVKVYLSLIPSTPAVEQQQEKILPSAAATANAGVESTDNSPRADGEVPRKRRISVNEKDIDQIDHEILDFYDGKTKKSQEKLEKLSTLDGAEPFNIVTNAEEGGELSGSSVLSLPVQPIQALAGPLQITYGELPPGPVSTAFGENLDPKSVQQALLKSDKGHIQQMAGVQHNHNGQILAEIVRAELVEKQKLIEKLMEDVRVRTEAIQVVGKDIRELRQEKSNLLTKLSTVESQLAAKNDADLSTNLQTERMLKSSAALQDMDKDTLIRILNQMRDQLNISEKEKLDLQQVLRGAKHSIDSFAVMKKDYKELQNAHMEQTAYLQKIQSKINKIDSYKNTIQTQENVISKMQSVIESKIKHKTIDKQYLIPKPPPKKHDQRSDRPSVPTLGLKEIGDSSKEEEEKKAYLEKVESELAESNGLVESLEERVRELEEQLELVKLSNEYDDKSDLDSEGEEQEEENGEKKTSKLKEAGHKIDQLEAELISKGFRVSALEKQLESSTKEYSHEIARLRTKLFELEINNSMVGGLEDDEEVDMTDICDPMEDYNPDGDALSQSPSVKSVGEKNVKLAASPLVPTAVTSEPNKNEPEDTRSIFEREKAFHAANPDTYITKNNATAVGNGSVTDDTIKEGSDEEDNEDSDKSVLKDKVVSPSEANKIPADQAPTSDNNTNNTSSNNAKETTKDTAATNNTTPDEEKTMKAVPSVHELLASRPSIDTNIKKTIDIIDTSPGSATVGRKIADLKLVVHYNYNAETLISTYQFHHLEIFNFPQTPNKTGFTPYIVLSLPSAQWSTETAPVENAGPVVTWNYNGDEKTLIANAEQLELGSMLTCVIKRVSNKTGNDVEIGKGSLSLVSK